MKQIASAITLEAQVENKQGVQHTIMHSCDVKDVVPWKDDLMPPLHMKSMVQLNKGEKRFIIKQVWGNEKGGALQCEPGRMLEDDGLRAIFEFLQWQYQLPEFFLAGAAQVKLLGTQGVATDEGCNVAFELKEHMQVMKYIVLPIHADAPLHWTFLVLVMEEKAEEEQQGEERKVKDVMYIDWLKDMQSNARVAEKVLSILTVGENAVCELPAACNHYRQRPGSNDCGFAVWYALEVLMKRHRGEGELMLYPDPVNWRKKLKTFMQELRKQQQEWNMEVSLDKKPKFMIQLPGSKIVEKHEYDAKLKELKATGALKHKPQHFIIDRQSPCPPTWIQIL